VQTEKQKKSIYKSCFIVHTETGKSKHENQASLVNKLVDSLKVEGRMRSSFLREKLQDSYENMKLSVSITEYYLPSFEEIFNKACENLKYITVRKVNSDNDVLSLLNISTGELRLDSPMNIFIGGQILDRGITVQNLIGFFYGRNPKRMQQDTVMQHARIFGARTKEDMAVTRLYTTNRIYESMKRMHEADKALRNAFEKDGSDKKVAFIQKSADGKIIPCNPSKLLISNTVTLKPSGTLTVYGFETRSKTNIAKTVYSITETLQEIAPKDYEIPFLIPVGIAQELIDRIYDTFESGEDLYGCTSEEFKAAIEYASSQTKDKTLRGHVYCFSNKKAKNNARYKVNQRGKMYNDSYFDGKTDSVTAKKYAIDIPALFLSFQNGLKENDWKDAQFYWPVLFIQKNLVTSIFTTDSEPGQLPEDDDDYTDDTGPLHKPPTR
jgi:Z1 domain